MEHISILITPERYARPVGNKAVVRDNRDYVVEFVVTDGSGFNPENEMTAIFVTSRGFQKQTFTGNTFLVPMLTVEDGSVLKIGLSQGDLMTTSYAVIPIIDSIMTNSGMDVDKRNADIIRARIGIFNEDTNGLVPATGEVGENDKRFLHADGTWKALEMDDEPTEGSDSFLSSGVVFEALKNSKEFFVATYGTTTHREIQEAVALGKKPMAVRTVIYAGGNRLSFGYCRSCADFGNDDIIFDSGDDVTMIVSADNSWRTQVAVAPAPVADENPVFVEYDTQCFNAVKTALNAGKSVIAKRRYENDYIDLISGERGHRITYRFALFIEGLDGNASILSASYIYDPKKFIFRTAGDTGVVEDWELTTDGWSTRAKCVNSIVEPYVDESGYPEAPNRADENHLVTHRAVRYALAEKMSREQGASLAERVTETERSISALTADAPEALDTLKEIADWISEDETGTAALINRVADVESGKVDKEVGKRLSTNDYDAVAKNKVDAIPENPKYTDTLYDDTDLRAQAANLQSQINDLGEAFRLQDFTQQLNVAIPPITSDVANTAIPKITIDLDVIDPTGELGNKFAVSSLAKYEIWDAETGGNRINATPVCMFSEGGQKKLSVRFMCAGSSSKTALRISGAILLKHR